MKTLFSISLVALVLCLGLAWWVRTDAPAVDGTAGAVRNIEGAPAVPANRVIARSFPGPPSWIPSDAERPDDQGAFATWVPVDAERPDDEGTSRTWIATDAERENDQGALLVWTATDAERDDDVGVVVHGFGGRM